MSLLGLVLRPLSIGPDAPLRHNRVSEVMTRTLGVWLAHGVRGACAGGLFGRVEAVRGSEREP